MKHLLTIRPMYTRSMFYLESFSTTPTLRRRLLFEKVVFITNFSCLLCRFFCVGVFDFASEKGRQMGQRKRKERHPGAKLAPHSPGLRRHGLDHPAAAHCQTSFPTVSPSTATEALMVFASCFLALFLAPAAILALLSSICGRSHEEKVTNARRGP